MINQKVEPQALVVENSFGSFGEAPDIALQNIVDRYTVNSKFDTILQLYAAYTVARGFTNTVNTDTPRAKAALDSIDNFTTLYELEDLNQLAMYEAWASGNSFFDTPGEGGNIDGLYNIPLGSIIGINRESNGTIIDYQQQFGGQYKTLQADQVAHLKINPKNGSAYGEMLGQPMSRQGIGYKTSNGNTVRKASDFTTDEMFSDIATKIFYSGQDRFVITPADPNSAISKDDVEKFVAAFSKTDPLRHIGVNKRFNVISTGLTSDSKFDAYITKQRDDFILATKSAIIPLITSLDFTFASSQTALEAAFPLMIIMQSDYANFINNQIYRPLTIQGGWNPDKIKVTINWKTIDRLSIELIKTSWDILKEPQFDGLYNPEDFVNAIREVGMPLEIVPQIQINMIRQKQQENRIIRAIQEVIDKPDKINEVVIKSLPKNNHQ